MRIYPVWDILYQGSFASLTDALLAGRSLNPEDLEAGPHGLSTPLRLQLLELYGLLDEIGMSLPEISLRFVLSNPNISCPLMGARSEEEVELNIAAAARGPLPPEILARLDQLVAMVPFRPTDEPACLPLGRDQSLIHI